MASGRFNTMAEGLEKIVADLSVLMLTPDADLEFLTQIQTQLMQKARAPFEGQGPQLPPMGGGDLGASPMAPPPGMGPGAQLPIAPAGGAPSPIPGGNMQPSPPNPDELRRLLSP